MPKTTAELNRFLIHGHIYLLWFIYYLSDKDSLWLLHKGKNHVTHRAVDKMQKQKSRAASNSTSSQCSNSGFSNINRSTLYTCGRAVASDIHKTSRQGGTEAMKTS